MPALGADMSAGTLVAWLKKPGDAARDIVTLRLPRQILGKGVFRADSHEI